MDKRIEYIARVFADAAGAEERENDVQFWAAELDGVVFLAFQTDLIVLGRRQGQRAIAIRTKITSDAAIVIELKGRYIRKFRGIK